MASNLRTQPPSSTSFALSYPSPHILLVTINREKTLNSIPSAGHWEAHQIFTWYDQEPSLRVAIITGAGSKAFSTGQDLAEVAQLVSTTKSAKPDLSKLNHPPSGFCGLSRRTGKKPVIAAVNGFALGGGFEICLNCDLIVAAPHATFGLPEAAVGLYAMAGGLPRLTHIVGIPLASEITLAGKRLSAAEALELKLVNSIAEDVVGAALELGKKIVAMSPDGVIVTRHGLRQAWEGGSIEENVERTAETWNGLLFAGENLKRGLGGFVGRKKVVWVDSKI